MNVQYVGVVLCFIPVFTLIFVFIVIGISERTMESEHLRKIGGKRTCSYGYHKRGLKGVFTGKCKICGQNVTFPDILGLDK